jgi:hypothetical protein
MATPLFVNTWKQNIMHLGDDGTFMTACYIGPGMCFGSSPPFPHPPPHTLTHTHTQTHTKINQSECADQRIGCLTCCLKHTMTTTPCKRRKIMRLTQTTNMDYKNK